LRRERRLSLLRLEDGSELRMGISRQPFESLISAPLMKTWSAQCPEWSSKIVQQAQSMDSRPGSLAALSVTNTNNMTSTLVRLDRRGQFYIFSVWNGLIHDIVCAILPDDITLLRSLTLLNFHSVPFFRDIRFQSQWQIIA